MASDTMSKLYPWQQGVWKQWTVLLEQQRLHHAVLFIAPKGSGRDQLTNMLSDALLCQNTPSDPCGICHGCQLRQAGTHPDYHRIEPAEAGKKISVDAIRQANRWAMETSQLGGVRVIEIRQADALGEAAANALLKTLEEPPSGCYYLLTADRTDSVLPTILSRCSHWRQREIAEQEIHQWLSEQTFFAPEDLLRIYRQSPLVILKLAEGGNLQGHDQVIAALTAFIAPPHLGMKACLDAILSNGDDALLWIQFFLLDTLKCLQGCDSSLWIHQGSGKHVLEMAKHCQSERLWSQLQALHSLQQQFTDFTGLNREIMIADWLSQFMQGDISVS